MRRVALLVARPPVALGAVIVLFTTLVAAYPTEWIYRLWIRAPLQPLTRLLLEGRPHWVTGVPSSWLGSNRLVLPDADLGVEDKLVAFAKTREALAPTAEDKPADQAPPAKVTLSLRGRDLSYASLDRADLRQADFTNAKMRAASLSGTRLHGANLAGAQLQDANLRQAQLQGANLTKAQLQGADLTEAQLQGAQLQGAHLSGAQLHGANLSGAQLQGANLSGAQLQGANLLLANVYRTTCPVPLPNVTAWRCLQPAGAIVADIIARLTCGAEGAPHVARGLLRNRRLQDTRHYLHDIAAHMQKAKTDATACPGVNGFLDADWQQLDALVKAAPPKPDAAPSSPSK